MTSRELSAHGSLPLKIRSRLHHLRIDPARLSPREIASRRYFPIGAGWAIALPASSDAGAA